MSEQNASVRQLSVAQLKDSLINLLMVFFSVISVPLLIISLFRIKDVGVLPVMYLHVLIVFIIIVMTLLRQRISFFARSLTVIGFLFLVGLAGTLQLALSGVGIPFLLASIVVATILYGRTAGSILLTVCMVIVLGMTLLVYLELITFQTDFNYYNRATTAWLSYCASFFILASILLVILGRFHQYFFDLVNNLEHHVAQSTEELILANKAKSEFLANMSHEIRTPMNGVLGMLSLLAKTPLTEDQRHKVGIAESSAHSLLLLINDILDFSKIDAGKLEIDFSEFDLRQVLGEICQANALVVQENGVELVLDISGVEFDRVTGDSGKIRQVLNNLIGNAAKFTHEGEIVVTARLSEKLPSENLPSENAQGETSSGDWRLAVSVSDTGIGIAEEKLELLFEAFTQADASTTRQYGGTGLGLAISRRLCELMNGTIQVTSRQGHGSCFVFDIAVSPAATAKKIQPQLPGDLSIMILDPCVSAAKALARQLTNWGITATITNNKEQALVLINQSITEGAAPGFDSIWLDYNLADKDFSAELVQLSREKPLKILLMTSLFYSDNPEELEQLHATAWFSKPATSKDLLKMLQRLSGQEKTETKQSPDRPASKDLSHEQKISELKSTNANILVVEDNFVNQLVLKNLLHNYGLSVEFANNGQRALQLLENHPLSSPYHLILMDCQMPEMDGYEATALIRNGECGELVSNLPIIALTANALSGDKDKCLNAGMNDYLSKPVEPSRLLNLLHTWLCGSASANN